MGERKRCTITTIAYRLGILAFDSKAVENDTTHKGLCDKGRQTKALIMAGCGNASDIECVMNWLEAGGGEDKKKDFNLYAREVKCEVIAIDKKGIVTFYEESCCGFTLEAPFFAIGSGYDLAMGAMAAGASAKEAIQIACKYNINTGGPVRTLNIQDLQLTVKKKSAKRKK